MADRKIIKNGLVLTFDKEGGCGYYNIIITGDKIAEVDQTGKLTDEYIDENYPEAEIIDAAGKILIPGFINSNLNSSARLSKIFFKRNVYESLGSNISLEMIGNYFKSTKNSQELYLLIQYSLNKALSGGETSVVEASDCINSEFYSGLLEGSERILQDLILCAAGSPLHEHLAEKKTFHFIGFGREDNVNTYSLNALKKYADDDSTMICCDLLNSEKAVSELKESFGRSTVKILDDYGILNENVFFTNPVYITEGDADLIKEKNAGVIFNTTDYIKLAKGKLHLSMLMEDGINVTFGTGYLGSNILSEMKKFAGLFYTPKMKYSGLLRNAILSRSFPGSGNISPGKQADIIFFSLEENILSIPELDEEKISEFIIEELTTGDIRDVMKSGEFAIRDGIMKKDIEMDREKVHELSEEIYNIGNYFGFKEKYLMKKRVDEVSMKKKKTPSEDMILEDAEVTIGVDDGFRIVGVKKSDDYVRERPLFEHRNRKNVFITEVTSFSKGFEIFPEKEKDKNGHKTEETSETENISQKPGTTGRQEAQSEIPEDKRSEMKRIKFGFSDSGE